MLPEMFQSQAARRLFTLNEQYDNYNLSKIELIKTVKAFK
jgi:hypothetical protein